MNIAAKKLNASSLVGHPVLQPNDGDGLLSVMHQSAPSVDNLDNHNNDISSASPANNPTNVKDVKETTISDDNVSNHQDRWGDNIVLTIDNSPGNH